MALAAAAAALAPPTAAATDEQRARAQRERAAAASVRAWTIHYGAHNGMPRAATILLPSWYGPDRNPPLPLVISPHGRGLSGEANARIWGDLPARGPFAVVSPDGHGRVLDRYSWGYAGQIDDLARMPRIAMRALPWLRIELTSVYAFGGSMGGQETLLLLARHPGLLAGAAAFDPVTDLARQYEAFARLSCTGRCLESWGEPLGRGLQKLAQREVGGSPATAGSSYAARSPLAYAGREATLAAAQYLGDPLRLLAARRADGHSGRAHAVRYSSESIDAKLTTSSSTTIAMFCGRPSARPLSATVRVRDWKRRPPSGVNVKTTCWPIARAEPRSTSSFPSAGSPRSSYRRTSSRSPRGTGTAPAAVRR